MIEWGGRQWDSHELPATAASAVAALASPRREDQLLAALDVLCQAGVVLEDVVEHAFDTNQDADWDLLDLVGAALGVGTARPWRSTVGLCRMTVTQWSTVRGRLIEKGIADPLRQLPSLTALLDVVEVMVLDGMEKDEDRDRFLKDLYRRDDALAPPPGWEDGAQLDGVF